MRTTFLCAYAGLVSLCSFSRNQECTRRSTVACDRNWGSLSTSSWNCSNFYMVRQWEKNERPVFHIKFLVRRRNDPSSTWSALPVGEFCTKFYKKVFLCLFFSVWECGLVRTCLRIEDFPSLSCRCFISGRQPLYAPNMESGSSYAVRMVFQLSCGNGFVLIPWSMNTKMSLFKAVHLLSEAD